MIRVPVFPIDDLRGAIELVSKANIGTTTFVCSRLPRSLLIAYYVVADAGFVGGKVIGNIDLAGSILTCEKDKKWSHYLGYFSLNNEQYYTLQKYSSCDDFKAEMAGKSLMAKYLKSNGLIVELKSDDQILYNSGVAGSAFGLVFAWFLAFAVVRLPVRWLLKKYA